MFKNTGLLNPFHLVNVPAPLARMDVGYCQHRACQHVVRFLLQNLFEALFSRLVFSLVIVSYSLHGKKTKI